MARTVVLTVAALFMAAAADAGGQRVTFGSGDGPLIAGELYEASSRPAPAVVLIHMLTRNKADWDALAMRIQEAGITALAIDLRGHGSSTGAPAPSADMANDVRGAVQWLSSRPGVRPGSIAVVGASLGASLALLAAVDQPAVRAIGVISPSLDYRGVRTDTSLLKKIGARPIWLAASAEDPLALRTLRDFANEPSGPREQMVSGIAGHGTALLAADPEVGRALVDWLRRSLLS
jgi:alpha-beta hydrolase superfamily lysophospholipase